MTHDHNADNLALQRRIGELEAVLIQRDDQMRELQQQLAAAREQIKDMTPRSVVDEFIKAAKAHNAANP